MTSGPDGPIYPIYTVKLHVNQSLCSVAEDNHSIACSSEFGRVLSYIKCEVANVRNRFQEFVVRFGTR